MKEPAEFEACALRLKALADPERLRIVTCLFGGAKNVGDLAAELKDEVVKVSHHLKVLRNAGLVMASKEGRFVTYRLHPDVVPDPGPRSLLQHIDIGCCRLELPVNSAPSPCKPRAKT
jgi:DNA-binding transcriptional ArsR family regulator